MGVIRRVGKDGMESWGRKGGDRKVGKSGAARPAGKRTKFWPLVGYV